MNVEEKVRRHLSPTITLMRTVDGVTTREVRDKTDEENAQPYVGGTSPLRLRVNGVDVDWFNFEVCPSASSAISRRAKQTPTRIVHLYPPAPDNPGRVSDGAARDLKNQAEAYHKGSQADAIAGLRYMGDREHETPRQRNARKRARKARRP